MIYSFSLKSVGLTVGFLLLAIHAIAFLSRPSIQSMLRHFARNKTAGTVLLTITAVWSFCLIKTMDLGEFTPLRSMMLMAIPIIAILTWQFVDEFLAVRALGILALLASEPLLESAFLKPQESRLLLVVLAYAWIIAGLFWVGMPFLFRDQVKWVTGNSMRWNFASSAGIVYGIALVICAFLYY